MPETATPPAPPAADQAPAESPQFNPAMGSEFAKRVKQALSGENPPEATPEAPKPPAAPPEAPAKAQDKPSESKPDHDFEPPSDISPKATASWKQLKQARAEAIKAKAEIEAKYNADITAAKAERARIEAELADVKKKFNPKEIETLKAERDQFYKKLRVKDIEALPDVQREIITPMKRSIEHAASLVAPDQRAKVKALLEYEPTESRDEALGEILDGMQPWKAAAFAKDVATLDEKREAKAALMKDTDNLVAQFDAWEAEQAKGKELEQVRAKETAFTEVLAALKDPDQGLPIFQRIDGDEKHNAAVDEVTAQFKQLATGNIDPKTAMSHMAWSLFGQKMVPLITQQADEIGKLKEQITKLTATAPKASSTPAESKDEPVSFVDAFKRAMASQG